MKKIYPRLAFTGIKKNRKLYLPYILSCIGAVTVYYIIAFLSQSPAVKNMTGGGDLSSILGIGKFVIAAFSLIFLFYTNSFLIRRRNREFGLYNMLGMGKKGICRIILWETMITALMSIGAGLVFGIAFSKLAELLLIRLCRADATYSFSIPLSSVGSSAGFFLVIFILLAVKSVISVRRSDPLELMHSESTGEKPPKANFILAISGVLILGAAYFIAVYIKSPLSAIFAFMIAVIMVIIGTYLLFISGSVALCRILQKNKKYYYKKNHFVSVSSMVYRMKRNGAGLASVCILSTMVLVMAASTASLYFGAEDAMKARYPQECQVSVSFREISSLNENTVKKYRDIINKAFDENSVRRNSDTEYGYVSVSGLLEKDKIQTKIEEDTVADILSYEKIRSLFVVDENTYNRIMNTDIHLTGNESMCYAMRCKYNEKSLEIGDVKFDICGKLENFPEFSEANVNTVPSVMLVIHDLKVLKPLEKLADYNGDQMINIKWYYGCDPDCTDTVRKKIQNEIMNSLNCADKIKEETKEFYTDCLSESRGDFYITFGGLFFIGGMFSLMFIFAMAMIIYYKQISEGYEDAESFGIMQKVGMTKQDIKKSINSQTLTVFFAPLIFAGIHFSFAFPPIWKILRLFHLNDLPYVIIVSVISFAIFGIIYMAIYKATARTYFSIVSAGENRE